MRKRQSAQSEGTTCPHDRTPMDFHGDFWVCPTCGDEWSTDTHPAPLDNEPLAEQEGPETQIARLEASRARLLRRAETAEVALRSEIALADQLAADLDYELRRAGRESMVDYLAAYRAAREAT